MGMAGELDFRKFRVAIRYLRRRRDPQSEDSQT
jgi:hypothetical protein